VTTRPVGRLASGALPPIAVLVGLLIIGLGSPAAAQDGPTFGFRPAPGEGDRSAGAFNLSLAAGSSVSDAAEVLNFADEPTTLDVYVTDVVTATSGGLAPTSRDAERTGPATWITIERPTIEVPPRGSTPVGFTVAVPADTPPGPHRAALLVELPPTTDGAAVGARMRVGLWVNVSVTTDQSGGDGGSAEPFDDAWLWLIALGLGVGLALVLAYLTRDRWRDWLRQRQEERALLRDFRARRRAARAARH
jgi:hypothetical protein